MRGAWLVVVLAAGSARGGEPEELAPGDSATITVGAVERRRAARHYGPAALVTIECVEDVAHFRELDRTTTTHLHPVDPSQSRLPSGAPLVRVRDRTFVTVLEVRPPDGVTNDTEAVRVRVDAGPLKGRELWVRRRMMVPRGTTRAARERRRAVTPHPAPHPAAPGPTSPPRS